MAVNYSTNAPSGKRVVSGGRSAGDIGVLLIGDSNMCGAGGGVRATLINSLFQWDNDVFYIDQVSISGAYIFNHTLNSGVNEVGPDAPFCDTYATERGVNDRVVGLPCGDSGSGFSTNQWRDGEQMYNLMQSVTNQFLAAGKGNTIGAVLISLGANDVGDFSPASDWRDEMDSFIQELRVTAFVLNTAQYSFAEVPILLCGMAYDWYNGNTDRQAIQDFIETVGSRNTHTAYASSGTLPSQVGDLIHVSGDSNITIGGTNAWQALLTAEANT